MSISATSRQARPNGRQNAKPSRAGKRANGAAGTGTDSNCTPARPSPGAKPHANTKPGLFTVFAQKTAQLAGRPTTFMLAALTIVVWGMTGPLFGYSDTWQLVINTGTTIVTFLMVFLIQNTQNRDAKAIHLKLDELIRGVKGARNHLVNLEELTDDELADLQRQFEHLRTHAAKKVIEHAERAGEQAEHATRVAYDARDTSEQAEDTADDAHEAARDAKRKAEEADDRARRAEQRAANAVDR